jgi:TP901 family phage tail tape measure protein
MSNREIEAILKISSRLGSMQALKTLQRELKAVDNQAKAYSRTQAELNRGLNASGMLIGRYLTGASLGYAALDMTRTGARIEDAMFGIQKKSGASAAQIAKLKGEILSLGQEVPVSIEETASAFERGAAAGIPLEDLREFAKLTTQVSDSWDMTAEDTANAFAGFSAGIGIKREDLEQFADLINFLADSGIADESGIVDFLDRAGASLKNFGMSPEESAAFGAALLNLKMAPEIAARAMDTLAGKLIAPENLSKSSFGALKEIVGDVEKFQALVANDGAKGMIEFFDRLDKMSGQKRTSLLGALMGEGFDDEVARMVDGIGEIKKNLELAQQENLYKGSIAGLSEKKLDLFSSKLQLLKNDLTEFKDNLFEVSAKDGSILDIASGVLSYANEGMSKNEAYIAGRMKKGETYWQALVAGNLARALPGGSSEFDQIAVDGGYNMDKQVLPTLTYDGSRPVFGRPDVPTPAKRPLRPGEAGYTEPVAQQTEKLFYGGAPVMPAPGRSHRDLENQSMMDMDRQGNDIADAIAAGAEQAGSSLKSNVAEGGDEAGSSIADAIGRAMSSAGDALAAKILNAVSSIKINVGTVGGGRPSGDPGVSGGDVTAVP